ncbi:MAG: 2-oxoacid:acceptor oxidoreductase family protein [Candidatus Caldatribacteriota bacterium]
MKERIEICLSGAGGQGLILAGIILAEAAGIYEGKEVVQTQSYGPEARGGASRSEVVISEGFIDYPKVTKSDILLVLTQDACDKYVSRLSQDGILIADSSTVKDLPSLSAKTYRAPISKIAQEKLGNRLVTNTISLGIIAGLTHLVSLESLRKAVLNRVRPRVREINEKALLLGYEIAQKMKLGKK